MLLLFRRTAPWALSSHSGLDDDLPAEHDVRRSGEALLPESTFLVWLSTVAVCPVVMGATCTKQANGATV